MSWSASTVLPDTASNARNSRATSGVSSAKAATLQTMSVRASCVEQARNRETAERIDVCSLSILTLAC